MAIYHCSMKNGSKQNGKSHASYISCAGKYEAKSDLEYLGSMNIPRFASSAISFFDSADKHERKNGRTYKEFELSLPRELTLSQNKQLIGDFIDVASLQKQPAIIALHCGKNGDNPHCHLMFSERQNADFDEQTFFKRNGSKKDRLFNDKAYLVEMRGAWETVLNKHLEAAGLDESVSCKSLKEQGVERMPQPKIGVAAREIHARGEQSTRLQRFDEVMQHNDRIIMRPVTELKADVDKQKLLIPRINKVQKIKLDLAALRKPRATAKVLVDVEAYMKHTSMKMHPFTVYNDTLNRFEAAQKELINTPWYKPWLYVENAFELHRVSKQYDAAHSAWSPVHDKLDYARQSTNNELQMTHKKRVRKYDDTKAELEFELKHEVSELEAQFNVSFSQLEYAVRPAVAVLEREQASMKLEAERRAESDFKAYEKRHQSENKPSDFDMC